MTEEVTTTASEPEASDAASPAKASNDYDYTKQEALSRAHHLWMEIRSKVSGAENDIEKMTSEIVTMAKKFEAYLRGL